MNKKDIGITLLAVIVIIGGVVFHTIRGNNASLPSNAQIAPLTQGVIFSNPQSRTVSGSMCSTTNGDVSFAFPDTTNPELAFTIGASSKYSGAGVYTNIPYTMHLTTTVSGMGTVSVNTDKRTGSFVANDNNVLAQWSCASEVTE